MNRVGVFGGTFNPPHIGHYKAAESFIRAANLQKLYIIPTGVPPHKELKNNGKLYPTFDERLEMTKFAFSDLTERCNCDIIFSDIEKYGGKSYTILTIRKLLLTHKAPLYLYLGTDMFLTFDSWQKFDELLRDCVICVMDRDGHKSEIVAKKEMFESEFSAKILFIDAVPEIISSSSIRHEISLRGFTDKVAPSVMDYISRRGLYL